ncbi:uncharacterized protein L3040_005288 [Drepanopeziza brunnea f. sp. 'multigermtubi']|uniref:uncharacterized protein n=1 Tax=Drepanopeziza brunnea f. sp. 'multigermtubi' TaxID=698441 RepID=UPI00238F6C6D|nr:hypothetical protein L3040_005288 [Drepanopeziza brunnea f. sp. 'multigermtubi']
MDVPTGSRWDAIIRFERDRGCIALDIKHEGYGAEIVTWRETGGVESIAVDEKRPRVNGYPMCSSSSKVEIDFGKETLMVNAAIMNEKNQPTNDPWIYDLDLETGRA